MTFEQQVHGASPDHIHEVSLEDTFDFLNTLEMENGFPEDHFSSLADAAGWLLEHGIVHPERFGDERPHGDAPTDAGDEALTRIRSVRAALREISDALAHGRTADPGALAEVNRALQARERTELVQSDDGLSVGHSHVGDPVDDALARLAVPLVDEIRAGHADRVRICDNDTCRWMFYDESRAGRRRWCDMSSCGNKAKAARHRARVKAAAAATQPEN